ncbi:lipopolysaccharide transport periplasmic protein LptA [Jannaschia sp. Os4]|uniref:lipopolysaccharide transport periplasmic protein LptA n=1 Tax=Jannaschia sp. Os4 TaxID=2807617 RepID=UPI00193997A7|nr:lipopolysaccharide transport periplasmic protein LptA [Jannaschia sp. Os4]MBM2575624.1 lipopolysaccharide transport periplasmic protein LptA [Jannaschia sp. Os4]
MIRILVPLALLAAPALAQTAAVGFGAGQFDRGAPVEVAADSLEVDQASGQAVLTGNVVVSQDEMRLSADRVEVFYATPEGGERQIDRIEATGDVVIVAGDDAAEGASATYRLGSGTIDMAGDVLVTQDGAVLAGDRLSVDLDSGAGTVTGRVRTTLQP